MCGIAGYAGWQRAPEVSRAELRAMCDAIRHRGPDDAGYLVEPGLALGMRRLSIIDRAGGAQPLGNEDGRIQVVFNGEIYNYRELREPLERAGHRFRTHSDTEVLVHLYEEHGARMVTHLRGMFAFALWDAAERRLLLARDRLGIKPLYYSEAAGGLVFASELGSLQALGPLRLEIEPAAVADYLALGYVPDPGSIYRGVHKLPPAHVLQWQPGRAPQVEAYWSPLRATDRAITADEAVPEIRRLLAEAVRYRLIAEVPLGAFLSGGVDSTAVVAEMARQMDRPVRTFSIGFEEPEFNEAPVAARVARALGTEHTELIVRPDVDRLVEQVVLAFDEPFADSSAIPTYLVSQLARESVTVALSGDGGDELFGGYSRYADFLARETPVPGPLRGALRRFARRLPHSARGRNRLLEWTRSAEGRYAGMVAYPLAAEEGGVGRPEVVAAGSTLDGLLTRWFEQVRGYDRLSQLALVDLLSYLPGDILTKVDRASMAVSLEARVPLLDHKLAEFVLALPGELKHRDGVGKWVFRRALAGQVPELSLAKRKQGFGVPLRPWFRHELRHRLEQLLNPGSPIYAYVLPGAVQRVVGEHRQGRRDHSPLLWRLLVLHLWLGAHARRGVGRPAAEPAARSLSLR